MDKIKIDLASKRITTAREKEEDEYQRYLKQLNNAEAKIKSRYATLHAKINANTEKFGNTTASSDDIIEINAGGKIIVTRREKLCQIEGSRLEALFCGRWDKKLPRDSKGRIFLDVNPTCFQIIVDYLNELAISSPDNLPTEPRFEDDCYDDAMLRQLIYLFGLCDFVGRYPLPKMVDTEVIPGLESVDILHDWLHEEGEDGELNLIYRMTRDSQTEDPDIQLRGAELISFHAKCNQKGSTVSLIKTEEGFVFGGYTNTSWGDEYGGFGPQPADKAFVFYLIKHEGARKMRLYDPTDPSAIQCQSTFGPWFGNDLYVINASPPILCVHLGRHYEVSGGKVLDGNDDDPCANFVIEEMEVFKVEKEDNSHKHALCFAEAAVFSNKVNIALNEKREALKQADKEVSKLEHNLAEEERLVEFFARGHTSDIIKLNVSGSIMTTNRSTLQAYKDSVLARQFDEVWTDRGCKNENIRVEEWETSDVQNWINSINGVSEESAQALEDITGRELLVLGRDGLEMLGVNRPGTVCLLLDEINKLQKSSEEIVTLIEHSPYCFGKILDFLRLKELYEHKFANGLWLPIVRDSEKERFAKIVDYFFPGDDSKLILG